MSAGFESVAASLNQRFLLDHPAEAAGQLERMPAEEAVAQLAEQPLDAVLPVWQRIDLNRAERLLGRLPDALQRGLMSEDDPGRVVSLLLRLSEDERGTLLSRLSNSLARELRRLMDYPAEAVGRIMDPRVLAMHGSLRIREAIAALRERPPSSVGSNIYLVDDRGRLEARVPMRRLVLADPQQSLEDLARPVEGFVQDLDSKDDLVERLAQSRLAELPVVSFEGRLVGVARATRLVETLREEVSTDIQTMVGASKDERALSKPTLAVRKRLPWLHVNLATAFLAAAVVGLFENTIAQFTALAVLLPVVAGQSGNAGAQALAVTMRGLVLREVNTLQWLQVAWKESRVGLLNGLAIALTTSLGVLLWSRSPGLALIIALSMVIAMVAAGFSGAIIPMLLTRLGQDPAQSSSIILTTVTDVVGFFSFLGIATLLSGML